MKKNYTFLFVAILSFVTFSGKAQTNLISNGTFVTNPWLGGNWQWNTSYDLLWSSLCGTLTGYHVSFTDDPNENYVSNYYAAQIWQDVYVPTNATGLSFSMNFTANTLEGGTPYDYLCVGIYNTGGALLYDLGCLSNSSAVYGVPGCSGAQIVNQTLPSSFSGQTIRLRIAVTLDGSNATLFRIDNVNLSYTAGCSYSLSTGNYVCANSSAGNYNNVANVNATAGCSWNAVVTSGTNWLSCSSSGVGNGTLNISVTNNTSSAQRTGTINVNGANLTVIQPGASCITTLSQSIFYCPTDQAGVYNDAATVVLSDQSCTFNATVISGSGWLNTSSSGTGNGTISFVVTSNPNSTTRTGVIDVAGENFSVVQPGSATIGFEENSTSNLVIAPNPAVEDIIIQFESNSLRTRKLEVIDQVGKVVLTSELFQSGQRLNVANLASGIYFVRLSDNSNVWKFFKE